jgi:autotransporter-associated beta strand protein
MNGNDSSILWEYGGGGGAGGRHGTTSAIQAGARDHFGEWGGNGGKGAGGGGGGGAGGFGALLLNTGASRNDGLIAGGKGGNGGQSPTPGHGLPGAGGFGVAMVGGGSFVNAGTIIGGDAGSGVESDFKFVSSVGGAGVFVLLGTFENTRTGQIIGGGIGDSKLGPSVAGPGIVGANATIINSGTINGQLGSAERNRLPDLHAYNPGGAAGIVGSDLVITNSGTIIGHGGAPALSFFGRGNTLTLLPGSSLTGGIETAGALTIDQPVPATLPNSITGTGSLIKAGIGTLTLTGANTYAGGTTVSGGYVIFSAANNFGSGRITLNGGGLLWERGTTTDISAKLAPLGPLGGVFNTNNSNITFETPISGTGRLIKEGFGNLTLAGTDTYSGGTIVAGGTLTTNGRLPGTVTLQGGTISGNATVDHVVSDGGVVSPGNAVGTMAVVGNYSQGASGGLLAEVSGAQGDRLTVGGIASLGGGAVVVSALPDAGVAHNTTYTILSAAGGVVGTFASVNEPYPFLQSSLSYDANNVYLNLQIGGFAAQALNPTQAAVGRVLDANVGNASGDFATVLGALATATAPQGQAVMTALSGQNYSTFSSTMVQGAYLFLNNFAGQTGGGSPTSNRVALAEACEVACDVTPPALWGAWGGALGGLGTIGANGGTGAVTYNAGGFAAGLDRMVASGLRVGVTTGFTTGTQWTQGFIGTGMTDTFLAGLYGNYRRDKVYADAVFGYGYSYNQMWRQIFVPGLQPRTAQGRTGANQWYGQIEGGYRFDIGTAADAYITPFMRWQGYTGAQNGFTESGAQSLNLTVAGQTTNSLRSVIGAQLGGAIDFGWREKLALQFRLGWSHEYASTARPVTATLAGAPLMPFTTYGVAPTRDGAVVGFSANTAIADGTSMYLRYEGNISGSDSAHALTAGVRMTW